MEYTIYQVDAFASELFRGNPAAVCPLGETWLPDATMQNIAMENNLAETAFYVDGKDGLSIRWFTPASEVDLCGHATLATAFVLFEQEGFSGDRAVFGSKSGDLAVTRKGNFLTLDFPADPPRPVPLNPALLASFDRTPIEAHKGKSDYLLVFENEARIAELRPNLPVIKELDSRGVIVTARGNEADFVSRFFAPQLGIDEDPVTGSAHTTLVPYWRERLGKDRFTALQLSRRGGRLECEYRGERVLISGEAALYMKGTIYVPERR
jgi:PhzF family phenazine biosynthesis protein